MNEHIYKLLQTEGEQEANLQISFHDSAINYSHYGAYSKVKPYALALDEDIYLTRPTDKGRLRWFYTESKDENIRVTAFYNTNPFSKLNDIAKNKALSEAVSLFPDLEIDELRESLEGNYLILFDCVGKLDPFYKAESEDIHYPLERTEGVEVEG